MNATSPMGTIVVTLRRIDDGVSRALREQRLKPHSRLLGENNLVALVLWHTVIRHGLKRVLKYTPG